MTPELMTTLFLTALFLNLAIEVFLNIRHQFHIGRHRNQVPEEFANKVSLEAHQKAADYSRAKLQLARFVLFFDAALLIFMTLGGGFQDLYNLWLNTELDNIWQDIGFIVSTLWFLSLLHLPFSIIATFKIEEAFGFNKMTPKKMLSDLLKGWALMLVLGTPLLWVILTLMNAYFDQGWWFYTWLVWMGFNLFILWAYPKWIAPLFNKFNPLEEGEMKQRIENLLQRTGFQSNGIFVMDGSSRSGHGNAYFTGMGKNKRIVFYDTLLDSLSPTQVEAVLAHELGHFKHGHIRKQLWVSMLMTLAGFFILAFLMKQDAFFNMLGVDEPSTYMALLLFMLVAPIYTFFIGPMMAWWSRKHEFEADDFAAKEASAAELVSALVGLYKKNAGTLTPDPLYSAFYDSHPPASIRIAHLKQAGGLE